MIRIGRPDAVRQAQALKVKSYELPHALSKEEAKDRVELFLRYFVLDPDGKQVGNCKWNGDVATCNAKGFVVRAQVSDKTVKFELEGSAARMMVASGFIDEGMEKMKTFLGAKSGGPAKEAYKAFWNNKDRAETTWKQVYPDQGKRAGSRDF